MTSRVLVNGVPQAHIAVADRGLQYGDGLFETLAVRDGIPQFWERHWQRLSRGCQRLGIQGIVPQTLRQEVCTLSAGMEHAVIKVIVTRGEAGRGYRPPTTTEATRIVARYPWPNYPDTYRQDGVAVRLCSTRLGRNAVLAGIKHLNRLEQVLARREWDDANIAEGLMLDDQGRVISGTMSNLFLVKAGSLVTPRLEECGVEGIMRGLLMELAAEMAIACREMDVTWSDLQDADELFLCNALIGIWPVRRLEEQAYDIGPVTRLIDRALTAKQLISKHEA